MLLAMDEIPIVFIGYQNMMMLGAKGLLPLT